MGDYVPKHLPGHNTNYQASAAVTGGQVVVLSAAGQCAPSAGSSAAVLGVATRDGVTGDLIAVSRGGVQRCVSSAAIAVGAPVMSAAAGRVATFSGTDYSLLIGTALTAAGGAAVTIDVLWKA